MPEGPPIIKRCVGCPDFDRNNGELDYPPPIEGCGGPLEVVKGLVAITDFTGKETLRVGDASLDSVSWNCERELTLTPKNSLRLTVDGVRTAFMLNRKTAAVVNEMGNEARQKLGDEIMQDYHSQVRDSLHAVGKEPAKEIKLMLVSAQETSSRREFSPPQVWAELNMLRQGSLVEVRAKQCGQLMDKFSDALTRILGDTDYMKGFEEILQRAKQSNTTVQELDALYHRKIEDYLAAHMSDNLGAMPRGYEQLQEHVNGVKLKQAPRLTSIASIGDYLNHLSRAIEGAPFLNLSRISNLRNRFVQTLLDEIDDDNAKGIRGASRNGSEAANQSSNSMERLRGKIESLANSL